MHEHDVIGIIRDVESRIGRSVCAEPVQGRNGLILKAYPWGGLPEPWSGVHVEASPEKRRGPGYSLHLDFYMDGSLPRPDVVRRDSLLAALTQAEHTASLVVGAEFAIDPRPEKMHFLVEQASVLPYDAWALDAKIAELMAHYIAAFDECVQSVSEVSH